MEEGEEERQGLWPRLVRAVHGALDRFKCVLECMPKSEPNPALARFAVDSAAAVNGSPNPKLIRQTPESDQEDSDVKPESPEGLSTPKSRKSPFLKVRALLGMWKNSAVGPAPMSDDEEENGDVKKHQNREKEKTKGGHEKEEKHNQSQEVEGETRKMGKASSSGGTSHLWQRKFSGLLNSQSLDARDAAGKAHAQLVERGDKLERLSNATEDLSANAVDFASLAEQLYQKEKNRKWWHLS